MEWEERGEGYSSANLDEIFADRFAIIHRIERSHLIHSHRRHLQHPGHLVHDADAGPAVLALAEIQERHDSRFLVLRGIALEDLIDESEVLGGEFEGDGRVVVGVVAVLLAVVSFVG